MNDTSPASLTNPKRAQELKAVADAERDPATAMAEGLKKDSSNNSEPSQPLDPSTHDTGQNYLGEETVFTPPKLD